MVRYFPALVIALLLVAGCHQTKFLPLPEAELPDAGAVFDAGEDRLEPSANTAEAVLSGQVAISGLTLLDDNNQPVAQDLTVTKVLARLVDPGDDILSIARPDAAGSFRIVISKELPSGKLRLTATVLEDLNGDGVGNDVLEQVVPVSLTQGREATLNIELAPAPPDVVEPLQPLPPGVVLLTRLTMIDASGPSDVLYATIFADGRVIADRDRDGILEPGDDFDAVDANSNGWPDDSEGSYSEPIIGGGGGLPFESLEGQVEVVELEAQTMTLRLDSGQQRLVIVDPFVSIEPYVPVTESTEPPSGGSAPGVEPTDPPRDFLGFLPFDTNLVGHMVVVNGYSASDGFHAQWIVVLDII